MTLTTAPTAPATSAATGPTQMIASQGTRAAAGEPVLLGERDCALDVRAPVSADDLAVGRLKVGEDGVVGGRIRGIQRAGLPAVPPVVAGVNELAEARRVRRGSRLRRNVPHRPDVAQRLDQLGHPTPRPCD